MKITDFYKFKFTLLFSGNWRKSYNRRTTMTADPLFYTSILLILGGLGYYFFGSFLLYFCGHLPIFWMSLVPKKTPHYNLIFVCFLVYGRYGFFVIPAVVVVSVLNWMAFVGKFDNMRGKFHNTGNYLCIREIFYFHEMH